MRELSDRMRLRVGAARVARLATVRPDGTPHVVPVTYALAGGIIAIGIDHKPKTTSNLQRLRNIQAQPAVSVLIDHYTDDWSELWWVRADGLARIVTEGQEHERAIAWLAEKYEQYVAHPLRGPVILIEIERWTWWP